MIGDHREIKEIFFVFEELISCLGEDKAYDCLCCCRYFLPLSFLTRTQLVRSLRNLVCRLSELMQHGKGRTKSKSGVMCAGLSRPLPR